MTDAHDALAAHDTYPFEVVEDLAGQVALKNADRLAFALRETLAENERLESARVQATVNLSREMQARDALQATLADRDARIEAAHAGCVCGGSGMVMEFEPTDCPNLWMHRILSGPAVPVPQDNPEATREQVGRVVWETSRVDEGTISATGANIVADAILAAFHVTPKTTTNHEGSTDT